MSPRHRCRFISCACDFNFYTRLYLTTYLTSDDRCDDWQGKSRQCNITHRNVIYYIVHVSILFFKASKPHFFCFVQDLRFSRDDPGWGAKPPPPLLWAQRSWEIKVANHKLNPFMDMLQHGWWVELNPLIFLVDALFMLLHPSTIF
jgi:hypothetical protein